MKFVTALTILLFSFVCGAGARAQEPAPVSDGGEDVSATYVIGEVVSIDQSKMQLQLKTSASRFTVLLSDKTRYLQLAPGEQTLAKGTPITLEQVGVGDRVMARGKVSVAQLTVPAVHVIVMKKEDISRKREREREEWRRRGIRGRITAINPQTREVTLTVRSAEGERPVSLVVPDNVPMRRYAPDSVRFDDAKPSAFGELKVGDVVRALGDLSADGRRFTPAEIVSGSFRMAGGRITSINAERGEVVINNILTKQPLTIVVTPDSLIRRILPRHALMLIDGGAKDNRGAASSPPPADKQAGAPGDAQDIVERLPTIALNELKVGDMILVSSTVGNDPARATAIILAAGAETIVNAAQRAQAQAVRGGLSASLGLSSGALDGAIGMP
jgi:hypothetical protein